MTSIAGVTSSSDSARYGFATCSARCTVSFGPCSPSTPSAGAPGAPYSATYRCPSNGRWPPFRSWNPPSAARTVHSGSGRASNAAPTRTVGCFARSCSAVTTSGAAAGSATPSGMVTTRAPAAFAVATAAASALASATTTVACREARFGSGASPLSGACRCSTSVSTDTSPSAWYQSAPSRSSSRATAVLVSLAVSSTGTWALAAASAASRMPSASPT
ncbi:hypothetical protein N8D77_17340 [Curtobacterium flaccumfaciens]|uniref:hypothetical protein n=1 Tax=Curtobacterium flaccumfaciens TaxID=2035 RepID=UPI0021C9BC7B|nr:hypothetical protein [Curtobacterium flaccumfaciens]UXN21869.1 hypothetical protein N8D77_17340 [Curtobacterium flaccumfaciens pv. flaccumfaciens]